jgi:DNA polymerase elongation subunit (family B)
MDKIIQGKGTTENIVNISTKRGQIHVFTENDLGVHQKILPYTPWLLADQEIDDAFQLLEGNNEYKYIRFFESEKHAREFRREWKERIWAPRNLTDAFMLTSGETYYNNSKRKDVSVLSWDLETSGLTHDERSKIYLIANTFRRGDTIVRKLFDLSNYDSQRHMLDDWCKWVRQMNPSILLGHNLMTYDCPYLLFVAQRCGAEIRIGRDGTELQLSMFPSKYRVDMSRNIEYRQPICFGREILDTMFLMMTYDVGKKYGSYALKKLIKEAGLEQENRTMVDASRIFQLWDRRHTEPDMWKKVCEYAEFDGDDALALWDLCGDTFFYPCQDLPMSLERICMSATGSQINSQLIRAYLADGHSIPKASEKRSFQGAHSYGFPGVYKNSLSIDINSLYPSVIIQYSVYDRKKDPKGYVLHMVKGYRTQRLEYKKLAAGGDAYYAALDSSAKRSLNSFFGFYGSKSNNFNSMECAELITRKGRETLEFAIKWATGKTFDELVRDKNAKG